MPPCPKIKILFTVTIILISGWFCSLRAQSISTLGTDFWLGFMENYTGDDTSGSDRMKVYITTDNLPASGTVSIPKMGWSENFSAPPYSTAIVIIPTDTAMCTTSEVTEGKGIHITSGNPVSVCQWNYVEYTSDANLVLPVTALGNSYRAVTYAHSAASPAWTQVSISEFLVVGISDSTFIKITPKCNTEGLHGANIPFTIMLNQGETYQVRAYYSNANNLSGSLIEIDTTLSGPCKKFAVFAGNECAFVPGDTCCCDHLCEQMMPVNSWGKKYITVPLMTRHSDALRIIGSENGTVFTINGGLPMFVNAGGTVDVLSLNLPGYIESNKPIAVAQFSKSMQTDMSDSDPFMMMIAPLELMTDSISFNLPVTTSINLSYFTNIVSTTSSANSVTLDGTNIGGTFVPVPGNPLYSYAQITTTSGRHILNSVGGVTVSAYALGNYESYGFIAGTAVRNLEASFDIITTADTFLYCLFYDTICIDSTTKFAASNNPDIIDHYWNFGDGSPVVHGQAVSHTYTAAGDYSLFYYYQTGDCGQDSVAWTIHVKSCNPSSVTEVPPKQSFTVYPNPNNGKFRIRLYDANNELLELRLFNIMGQIKYQKNLVNSDGNDIELTNFSEGIYFIMLETNKTNYFCKIIIQN